MFGIRTVSILFPLYSKLSKYRFISENCFTTHHFGSSNLLAFETFAFNLEPVPTHHQKKTFHNKPIRMHENSLCNCYMPNYTEHNLVRHRNRKKQFFNTFGDSIRIQTTTNSVDSMCAKLIQIISQRSNRLQKKRTNNNKASRRQQISEYLHFRRRWWH